MKPPVPFAMSASRAGRSRRMLRRRRDLLPHPKRRTSRVLPTSELTAQGDDARLSVPIEIDLNVIDPLELSLDESSD